DGFIQRTEVGLPAKDDVRRALDLHERPVVVAELSGNGTAPRQSCPGGDRPASPSSDDASWRRNQQDRRATMRDFNELKVWQKAHRLVLDIYAQSRAFPDDERFGLTPTCASRRSRFRRTSRRMRSRRRARASTLPQH